LDGVSAFGLTAQWQGPEKHSICPNGLSVQHVRRRRIPASRHIKERENKAACHPIRLKLLGIQLSFSLFLDIWNTFQNIFILSFRRQKDIANFGTKKQCKF
jgi:hypothetical protein